MIRPIIVLVSSLLFGLFGVLIGGLTVYASPLPSTSLLTAAYGMAPFGGVILGFVLSAAALWLFSGDKR